MSLTSQRLAIRNSVDFSSELIGDGRFVCCAKENLLSSFGRIIIIAITLCTHVADMRFILTRCVGIN